MEYRPQRLKPKKGKRLAKKLLVGATLVGLALGTGKVTHTLIKKHQATVKARKEFKKQLSANPLALHKRWLEFEISYIMAFDRIAEKTRLPIYTVIRTLALYDRADTNTWKAMQKNPTDYIMRGRARKIVEILRATDKYGDRDLFSAIQFIRDKKNRKIWREINRIAKTE